MFYVHIIGLDFRYCIFEQRAIFYSSVITVGAEEIDDIIFRDYTTALRQQDFNSRRLVTLDEKQRKISLCLKFNEYYTPWYSFFNFYYLFA